MFIFIYDQFVEIKFPNNICCLGFCGENTKFNRDIICFGRFENFAGYLMKGTIHFNITSQ